MPELSKSHKQALAKGRRQAKVVRDYLQALENESDRRGRYSDPDQVRQRIADLKQQIDDERDPANRLDLIQKRLDWEARLAEMEDSPDVADLEKGFKDVAREYSERKGITYSAWRELGVAAGVLREAGVKRGG